MRSFYMTNPIGNLQSNVARLEEVNVAAEGIKNSLNAQISQDQEAFVAAITARFQQTMQDSLAASEARQNAVVAGLMEENSALKKEVTALKSELAGLNGSVQNLASRAPTIVVQGGNSNPYPDSYYSSYTNNN